MPTVKPAGSTLRVLYIDSSALLKLLWPELESDAVRDRVASEDFVSVSSLAELENWRPASSSPRAGSPAGTGGPVGTLSGQARRVSGH